MTYDDFIASNPKERGFGMFTEEANNKVKTMMEEIVYTIFSSTSVSNISAKFLLSLLYNFFIVFLT